MRSNRSVMVATVGTLVRQRGDPIPRPDGRTDADGLGRHEPSWPVAACSSRMRACPLAPHIACRGATVAGSGAWLATGASPAAPAGTAETTARSPPSPGGTLRRRRPRSGRSHAASPASSARRRGAYIASLSSGGTSRSLSVVMNSTGRGAILSTTHSALKPSVSSTNSSGISLDRARDCRAAPPPPVRPTGGRASGCRCARRIPTGPRSRA